MRNSGGLTLAQWRPTSRRRRKTAEGDMNMLVVAGMPALDSGGPAWLLGHACAVCLFAAGCVMLAMAGYLLNKAPKFELVRYLRRR